MTEGEVINIAHECIIVALKLSLPILLLGLVAGVAISLFQAVTQIQEFTLTFVPKLLAVVLGLVVFGSWMLSTIVQFTIRVFTYMPPVSR